jgi:hypothetical protein
MFFVSRFNQRKLSTGGKKISIPSDAYEDEELKEQVLILYVNI